MIPTTVSISNDSLRSEKHTATVSRKFRKLDGKIEFCSARISSLTQPWYHLSKNVSSMSTENPKTICNIRRGDCGTSSTIATAYSADIAISADNPLQCQNPCFECAEINSIITCCCVSMLSRRTQWNLKKTHRQIARLQLLTLRNPFLSLREARVRFGSS